MFDNIEEYMLSAENITKYTKQINYENNHFLQNKNNIIANKPNQNKSLKKDIFIPIQKDKLFWSFYILLHDFESYEFVKNDSFKTEKNFKIESVEKLRMIKDKLKALKIKRNEIENEFVNAHTITLKGLQALCLIYNISLVYISGNKYHDFLFGDKIQGIIIQEENGEFGIKYEFDEKYLTTIRNDYWKIESINKPLRGLSAYSIKEIQNISTRLNICLMDDDSKKKPKKQLYEEIIGKM